jgi:hypothetical protein
VASPQDTSPSRRSAAAALSEEILADIELGRVSGTDVARKAFRLARMIDDFDAMEWLEFEVTTYSTGADGLSRKAWNAAKRSGRVYTDKDGVERARTSSLSSMMAAVQSGNAQISAAADAPVSVSSANPSQYVGVPSGNTQERAAVRRNVTEMQGLHDQIVGSVHIWVTEAYYGLRFGSAAEDAFAVVRAAVDRQLTSLVPEAVRRVAVAFENASSSDPEQWSNASAGCRRLIKATADELRPPGPDVNGRKMGDGNYINRLVDWITTRSDSETYRDIVIADLEFLGKRIDSLADAGNKGAHAEVGRFEASRYVTGTYLLLGDILQLSDASIDSPSITDDAAPSIDPELSLTPDSEPASPA